MSCNCQRNTSGDGVVFGSIALSILIAIGIFWFVINYTNYEDHCKKNAEERYFGKPESSWDFKWK